MEKLTKNTLKCESKEDRPQQQHHQMKNEEKANKNERKKEL